MSTQARRVTPEIVRALASMAALEIPEASVDFVADMLERQIAVIRNARLVDAHEVEPDIGFDPRWQSGRAGS